MANKKGLNLTLLVAGYDVLDLLVCPGAQDLYQHGFLCPRTLQRNMSNFTMLAHGLHGCSKNLTPNYPQAQRGRLKLQSLGSISSCPILFPF